MSLYNNFNEVPDRISNTLLVEVEDTLIYENKMRNQNSIEIDRRHDQCFTRSLELFQVSHYLNFSSLTFHYVTVLQISDRQREQVDIYIYLCIWLTLYFKATCI